jgi:hypothetical protein
MCPEVQREERGLWRTLTSASRQTSTLSLRRRPPSLEDCINCFDPDLQLFSLVESEL